MCFRQEETSIPSLLKEKFIFADANVELHVNTLWFSLGNLAKTRKSEGSKDSWAACDCTGTVKEGGVLKKGGVKCSEIATWGEGKGREGGRWGGLRTAQFSKKKRASHKIEIHNAAQRNSLFYLPHWARLNISQRKREQLLEIYLFTPFPGNKALC